MNSLTKRTGREGLEVGARRRASLDTPTDLGRAATRDISAAMNAILADTFALAIQN